MTTFSRLVDDIVTELLRPDMQATIATYVNQTVRDIHFRPAVSSVIMYDANRYEELLDINTDGTWLWSIPSATRFQDVEAIYLDQYGLYVPKRNPRVALEPSFGAHQNVYYYRSGPSIAVQGVGMGMSGRLSYFMFPQTLAYKSVQSGTRKIRFDPDTDSYVYVQGGGIPSEADLALETHWVLQRWADTVKEGVRAKVWKRLGEMERTRLAFSAFESMRTAIWNSEPSSGGAT